MCFRVKLLRLRHSLADSDVEKLAAASHGYVGADISALCQEAAMCALRRHVAGQEPRHAALKQPHPILAAAPPSNTEPSANGPQASVLPDAAAEPDLQVR